MVVQQKKLEKEDDNKPTSLPVPLSKMKKIHPMALLKKILTDLYLEHHQLLVKALASVLDLDFVVAW
jgi:hypothetical protein